MTQLILTSKLRPHEETDQVNLQRTIEALSEGVAIEDHPILVDEASLVILDGHHRYQACVELGIEKIPCILVDYHSSHIKLEARRDDLLVTKEEVIRRGLSGELYPPKTTKHDFEAKIA